MTKPRAAQSVKNLVIVQQYLLAEQDSVKIRNFQILCYINAIYSLRKKSNSCFVQRFQTAQNFLVIIIAHYQQKIISPAKMNVRCFLAIVVLNFVFITALHNSNVKELTLANFDQYVDGGRFAFVFFYAAWHNQCQTILERLEEVGDVFAERNDVIIAKVNAYEEIKLATRFWIDEYPSYRYFIKGSVTEET